MFCFFEYKRGILIEIFLDILMFKFDDVIIRDLLVRFLK